MLAMKHGDHKKSIKRDTSHSRKNNGSKSHSFGFGNTGIQAALNTEGNQSRVHATHGGGSKSSQFTDNQFMSNSRMF